MFTFPIREGSIKLEMELRESRRSVYFSNSGEGIDQTGDGVAREPTRTCEGRILVEGSVVVSGVNYTRINHCLS